MPPLPKPPVGEKGNAGQYPVTMLPGQGGGLASWGMFVETTEHVPELQWPLAVEQYERMFNDSQVWALFLGTILPLLTYHWWIDANGADEAWTALLAADLGLPTEKPSPDDQDAAIEPGRYRFDFGAHLWEALLALGFGHAYFEQVGEVHNDGPEGREVWHLAKLAPRPQSTISEILVDPKDGGLKGIRQTGVTISQRGPTALVGLMPVIEVDRLIAYVFLPDGRRRWIGRSMFRSIYREWLVKDRLLRVDAINHERAGGIPGFELDSSYEGANLDDLRRLASEWRVGEESGWVSPPGAKLHLARVGGTDVVGSMRYLDESMARAWQAMVRQLGQTQTGSRALGSTFEDLEKLFRQAVAAWFRGTFREHMIEDWWMWNVPRGEDGGPAPHPVLRCTPPAAEGPPLPLGSPSSGPGSGGPNPTVAARSRPRRGPAGDAEAERRDRGVDSGRGGGVGGSRLPAVAAGASLPARPLRRQPYAHEVAAAVDFAALDAIYEQTVTTVEQAFEVWLGDQITGLAAAIRFTKAGGERKRVTRNDLARISAQAMDADQLASVLLTAAQKGAAEAVDELLSQGVAVLAPTEAQVLSAITDHARAVSQQTADGLSLAASRKAVQLVGGRDASEIALGVQGYLHGLEHRWEKDQLAGAVQQASNAGRFLVFERVPSEAPLHYHASELLDASTCSFCLEVDGREYETLSEAVLDYPSGGFHRCKGGPRCRGMVVAVLPEAEQFAGDPEHLRAG